MNELEIKGLWRLLGQTWGAKFHENYGTEPNEAWTMMLSATSSGAARYALRKLIESGSPFPPTLPEFLVFARKWDRDNAPRPTVAIEAQPDADKARVNLERIRAMLNS